MIDKYYMLKQLKKLKIKSKFERDDTLFYPGVERREVKQELNNLINIVIDEFTSKIQNTLSKNEYVEIISNGLVSFNNLNLDTEDRERVCTYFEEIMDIVGLESSEGVINKWLYGFEF